MESWQKDNSAKEFKSAANALGVEITANNLDRFFCAAACHLEDSFDEPSAGHSLRRIRDEVIDAVTPDGSSDLARVRRMFYAETWKEVADAVETSVIVEKPRILTTHETKQIVETFDSVACRNECTKNLWIILRVLENTDLTDVVRALENAEKAAESKG